MYLYVALRGPTYRENSHAIEADDLGVRPPVMGNADAIARGVMCDPLRVARV